MRFLGKAARVALVGAAVLAAAASASNKQNQQPAVGNYNSTQAPPAQPMDPANALGLWKSTFGAVKIENNDKGAPGAVHGVWVYDRNGQEVVGYFGGTLDGNTLDFTWQEPSADGSSLTGAGYLVFETYGTRFSGRWWTTARDRVGDWSGWRQEPAPATTEPAAPPPEDEPPPADDYDEPYGGGRY